MSDWKTIDLFFDESLVDDPYPYFEALRAEGPVLPLRHLRMRNIRLSEEHHRPPGDRRFACEPTWVLRGLTKLHLEFDPVEAGA